MDNEQKIEKIKRWQTSGYVHELTCGNDDCRGILDAEIRNDEIVLFCPECNNYEQTFIPEAVFKFDVEAYEKAFKNFCKKD